MHSARCDLPVVFTEHAFPRMEERAMSQALVLDIIDSGTVKPADETHLWIYKMSPSATSTCCAWAAVVEKTVLHHWRPQP